MILIVGVLSGLLAYYFVFRKLLRFLKYLINYLYYIEVIMDANGENRIWDKIDKLTDDVADLKVEVGKIKVKVGIYAGIFSAVGAIAVTILKELIFK